ncbi:MAG: hypothetical protein ACRDG3_01485 [Tepidiformaceae bacterium]
MDARLLKACAAATVRVGIGAAVLDNVAAPIGYPHSTHPRAVRVTRPRESEHHAVG